MTVYNVMEYSYEDSWVVGTYTTRELAERMQELCGGDLIARVHAVECDVLPATPDGLLPYGVEHDVKLGRGRVERVSYTDVHEHLWEPAGDGDSVIVTCWATDEVHAAEIAAKRIAEAKANGSFTLDWKTWRNRNKGAK